MRELFLLGCELHFRWSQLELVSRNWSLNILFIVTHLPLYWLYVRSAAAITQLFQLNSTQPHAHAIGRGFGATFVMFSIVFLYFANARYFHSQHAMINGQFPASRGAVMIGSSILFAALIAMFAIILSAWTLIVYFHIVTALIASHSIHCNISPIEE